MTISLVGWGSVSGTNPPPGAYVAGSATDVIVAFPGGKPVTTGVWSHASYVEVGSVADGTSTGVDSGGSVVSKAYLRTVDPAPTGSGSEAWTTTSVTATIFRTGRFARTAGTGWGVGYVGLADTDYTGTTVAATGAVTAGQITAGDVLVVAVHLTDDVITHTGQALTVPGVTLSAVTWQTVVGTTQGLDAALYTGHATVTAGTSTAGDATYTATSSVSAKSGAAVSVLVLREAGAAPAAITGTAAQTTSLPVQVAAGTVTAPGVTGAAAQSTPLPTQAAAGTVGAPARTGTAAQVTPLPVQVAAGAVTNPGRVGVAAQTTPKPTQAAAGTVTAPPPARTGTATQTTPRVVQAATGSTVTTPTGPHVPGVARLPVLVGGVVPAHHLPDLAPTDAQVATLMGPGTQTRAAVVASRAGYVDTAAVTTATAPLAPASSLTGLAEKGDLPGKADRLGWVLVRYTGTAWPNTAAPAGGYRVFDSALHIDAPAPAAGDRDRWVAHPASTTFDAAVTFVDTPTPVLLSAVESTPKAVTLTAQADAAFVSWRWYSEKTAANGPLQTTTVPTRTSGAYLIPGAVETYWVTGVTAAGVESAPSNRITVTIAGAVEPVPTPTIISATEPVARSIRLEATPMTGALAYRWVDVSDPEGVPTAVTVGPVWQSGQVYTPGEVRSFYLVVEREGTGLTPASPVVSVTLAPPPTGVVSVINPDDDYRIHATWDGVDGATWQVNEVGTPRYANTTQRLFRSPWLTPGTYSYRVRQQTGSTTDPVTGVVTPTYGAWRTSNTVTVRAEPTPVGNQLKWAPWRDFGRDGVKTINVVRDVRITTPGDYRFVLPKDKPLAVGRMDWTVALPLGMEDERVRVLLDDGGELTPLQSAEIVIKLRANRGRVEWFFQGLRKHGENIGDGIQVDMQELVDTSVTIQDCDIRDVSSGSLQHADVYQGFGGSGNLRWYRNRFSSNYQGFMLHPTQFGRRLDYEAAYFGTYRIEKLHVHMVENPYFPKANPAAAWMGTGYYSIHQGERSPDRYGYPIIEYADCYLTSEDPTHTPPKEPNGNISSRAKLDTDGVTQIGASGNNSPGIWVNVIDGPPPGGSIFPPGVTPGLGYVNPGYAARVGTSAPPPPPPEAPADTLAPSKPTFVTVTPGDTLLAVSWVPGVDESGEPTSTRIRVNGRSLTIRPPGSTSFNVRVSSSGVPLVNGTEYAIELQAIDAAGNQSGDTAPVYGTPNPV